MKKHLIKLFCLLLPALFLTGCWQEELPEDTGLLSPGEELSQEPEPELLLPDSFSLTRRTNLWTPLTAQTDRSRPWPL